MSESDAPSSPVMGTAAWIRRNRDIQLSVLAIGVFSFLTVLWSAQLVRLAIDSWADYGFHGLVGPLASLAVGAGLGVWIPWARSRREIEFGLMPFGALIMAAASFFPARSAWGEAMYGLCGLGAGLFLVPLSLFIRRHVPMEWSSEVGRTNVRTEVTGVLAGGLCASLAWIRVPLVTGSVVLAVVVLLLLGPNTARTIAAAIARLFYRIRIHGLANLPTQGAALLVSNHASYADAVLLTATSHRRIRFVMSGEMFRKRRWMRPLFRVFGVVIVEEKGAPRLIASFLRECRAALDDGCLVCIFAEGAITRTGAMQPFRKGLEHIVRGRATPIIPVFIGGSYRTILSYFRGKLRSAWRTEEHRRHRVDILFGAPMPPNSTAYDVQRQVGELSVEYCEIRKEEHESVGLAFVRTARMQPFSMAVKDTLGFRYSRMRLLSEAIAIGMKLRGRVKVGEYVGLLFPASCYGVLGNVTCALQGWIAVNLNFTTSRAAFASSFRQCGFKTILTSRTFMEKVPALKKLPIPEESIVYIEDVLASVTRQERHRSHVLARRGRPRDIAHVRGVGPDSVFQVLFSSGSTGEPKGVMLSNHNILSQVEALRIALVADSSDRYCGILPFFHSFGVTVTLWYPLLDHQSAVYHPSPLDAAAVANIVRKNKCTVLMTTPSFLSIYQRRAVREDFASLRLIICGAEKLKPSLANAFEEKFGIRPLEGYGATEMSPVVSVGHEHGIGGGTLHPGWRDGSIGQPLPGIIVRVVHPETGAVLGPGERGVLQVKGPSRMLGYLGRPDLTAAVVRDGWYSTGDIAYIDWDGFIFLTDRQSRFSKIGGEMVPHGGVEEAILAALGKHGPVLAVAGVPDERKGERLVVLFTKECGTAEELAAAIERSDLPNLWKPAPACLYEVESVPILANGKMDLAGVKAIAREKSGV